MFELSPIEAELVRLAQERVFELERALAARTWQHGDPMKRDLENRLVAAQNQLSERLAHHEQQRRDYYR